MVERVLIIEGIANLTVMLAKATVGFQTGSIAVIGDAIHSLADFANNVVAFIATRIASAPPDSEHPYGHRKFETLAVFGIATLLSVLAIEIILGALDREPREISTEPWSLATMLGVLVVNLAIATWENRWARRLASEILRADARHTISDVLTTVAVIAGWQLAANGYRWLDALASFIVAAMIFYLAYGLFQKAIPVLVERSIANPEALSNAASAVAGGFAGAPAAAGEGVSASSAVRRACARGYSTGQRRRGSFRHAGCGCSTARCASLRRSHPNWEPLRGCTRTSCTSFAPTATSTTSGS